MFFAFGLLAGFSERQQREKTFRHGMQEAHIKDFKGGIEDFIVAYIYIYLFNMR